MKLYDSSTVDKYLNEYVKRDGEIHQIEEGTLGHGLLVLTGHNLKTTVIKEVYINEWSSGHSIRKYNVTPKKYQEMIDSM